MTKRFTLCVGFVKPVSVIGKHTRAVINRHIAEPDTIAIVKEPNPSKVYHLYRIDFVGRSVHIGWIQEETE